MTTGNIILKNTKSDLRKSIYRYVKLHLCKEWGRQSDRDLYQALSLTLRDRLIDQMLATERRYDEADAKRVYYLSIEFLLGRSLGNNLYNMGLLDNSRQALQDMGADLEEIRSQENDAGLGNGGLGRLAACFLDSLATLGLPGYGYGIHYEFGLFKQQIYQGYQQEKPDNWLSDRNPWEIERPDEVCALPLYGEIEHFPDRWGNYNPMWMNWQLITGVPFDMPVVGYKGDTVNYLRLFAARPSSEFDIQIFNEGDYIKAVEQKLFSENISKILYPTDSLPAGKELRLIQEYFLVGCSLRDIMRRFLRSCTDLERFPERVAIQMNDTHPSLAVAELMRLMVDEHELSWEKAWDLTRRTLAYTNHTLLPEALELWPVGLLNHVLPRHLQIIHEINHRFLEEVAEIWPDDGDKRQRMSLIEEGDEKKVRMAHLAMVGSHSINGVSALHSELLKQKLFPDFYAFKPEWFNNKTNGVTPRRWLLKANPWLSDLITEAIGDGWVTDLANLQALEPLINDNSFLEKFLRAKQSNKERLTKVIENTVRVRISPDSLFDIHAKRIHEYKRQLLNVMHIIHEYLCCVEDHKDPIVPYTYIFAGKAAPGYWAAKQIIKLINNVARRINQDPRVKELIKVVFIPDYRVSLAESIIPAADLSEQISTAGMEASGTGNMKFGLNGALTIGTLDGANVEILQQVGNENIFIFGSTVEDIAAFRQSNSYNPWDYYNGYPEIRRVLDTFLNDEFCPQEPGLFRWVYHHILHQGDPYFHLADFLDYLRAHEQAGKLYLHANSWAAKAVMNVARMGNFSSDRSILEYARDIWHLKK